MSELDQRYIKALDLIFGKNFNTSDGTIEANFKGHFQDIIGLYGPGNYIMDSLIVTGDAQIGGGIYVTGKYYGASVVNNTSIDINDTTKEILLSAGALGEYIKIAGGGDENDLISLYADGATFEIGDDGNATGKNKVLIAADAYEFSTSGTTFQSGINTFLFGANDRGTFTVGWSPVIKIELDRITNKITLDAPNINFANLPTTSAGLSAGDLWNDSGSVKII